MQTGKQLAAWFVAVDSSNLKSYKDNKPASTKILFFSNGFLSTIQWFSESS